jgi:uncharacterized protein with HEPN domain
VPHREWKLRISDILECVARIKEYTDGVSFEQFQSDKKTVDAVLRNLEIIGEAVRHIPETVQERYSELPWAEMRAMRNIVAHQYFGVNLNIIWNTTQSNLPPIVAKLEEILEKE